MRARVVLGAAVLTLGPVLSACSSGSGSTPTTHRQQTSVAGGSAIGHARAAGTASGPGVAATSLSCDKFSAADVQAAVAKQVASASAQAVTVSDSGGSDGLTCDYNVATPGTDLSSADRGMAQVTLTVSDVWDDTPITGSHDDAHQKDGYEAQRKSAQSAANGQAENNAIGTYHDVSGVGTAAYLVDTVHTDDSGTTTQYNVAVSVLRDPRPYRLEVTVDYVLPQSDVALPDKALDSAMRDESARAQLAQAIAVALLAKVG